ncbi:MAG: hypothetical protein JW894_12675 [Bacteroidales bacterium]|nr:hypothetical protein [Bacteroidales bacterium]
MITQIKVIKITPADDPINWYYYVSFSTKNTSSPFYVGYDPHNTYMGTYFIFDKYPEEFQEYATKSQEYAASIDPRNMYKEALEIASVHKDSFIKL